MLVGTAIGALLPRGGGQQPAHFPKNIDAGQLTKAQALHLIVDHVHAHVIGQDVVIGVAGLDDGCIHIDQAMAALFVVAKAVRAQHEITRVDNRLLGASVASF